MAALVASPLIGVANAASPSISRERPSDASFSVEPDTRVTFEARASDPDGDLDKMYWSLTVDGSSELKKTDALYGNSGSSLFAQTFDEEWAGTTVRVRAWARDAEKRSSSNLDWNVEVSGGTTPEPNRPPTLSQTSPSQDSFEMVEGATSTFSVEAADADGNLEEVIWSIEEDGDKPVAKRDAVSGGSATSSFEYTFRASQAGKQLVIWASAKDSDAVASQYAKWYVTVKAGPGSATASPAPQVSANFPSFTLPEGETQNIRFKIYNDGSAATDYSHLTISASSNLRIVSWGNGFDFRNGVIPVGSEVSTCTGTTTSQYALLEGYAAFGESAQIYADVAFEATAAGDGWIQYRASLAKEGRWDCDNFVRDPAEGQTDQQGFPARSINVAIREAAVGGGCSASQEYPLVSLTSSPWKGPAPLSVVFSWWATNDCPLASWRMDFGDGSTEEGPWPPPSSFTHTYTSQGARQAELRVEAADGSWAYRQARIEVQPPVEDPPVQQNRPPVASVLLPTFDVSLRLGAVQEFIVQCTDPDGNADYTKWWTPNYPDGNAETRPGASRDFNEDFTEAFATVGNFRVRVRCYDTEGGESDEASWTVTVVPFLALEGAKGNGVGAYFIHGIFSGERRWFDNPLVQEILEEVQFAHGPTYVPLKSGTHGSDWKLASPPEVAAQLKHDLDVWRKSNPQIGEIWLVGHSNGGLMARQIVTELGGPREAYKYGIRKLVTLDSPDLGANEGGAEAMEKIIERIIEGTLGPAVSHLLSSSEIAAWKDYAVEYLTRTSTGQLNGPWRMPSEAELEKAGITTWRFVYGDPVNLEPLACREWTAHCLETSGNLVVPHTARENRGAVYLTNDKESYRLALESYNLGTVHGACQVEPGYSFVVAGPRSGAGDQHSHGDEYYSEAISEFVLRGWSGSGLLASGAGDFVIADCDRWRSEQRGDLGAVVKVDSVSQPGRVEIKPVPAGDTLQAITAATPLDVAVRWEVEGMVARLKSADPRGKTVIFQLGQEWTPDSTHYILVDGKRIPRADGYEDVLDPGNDEGPEYLEMGGAEGMELLVSIDHFSERIITIRPKGQTQAGEGLVYNPFMLAGLAALATLVILLGWKRRRSVRAIINHSSKNVRELRNELRRRGLSVGGRKAELVERLRADDWNRGAGPRAPSWGSRVILLGVTAVAFANLVDVPSAIQMFDFRSETESDAKPFDADPSPSTMNNEAHLSERKAGHDLTTSAISAETPSLLDALQTPLRVEDQRFILQADDFYVSFEDGRRFTLGPEELSGADIHGDPGNGEYRSIELTWAQHGVEMRLFIYLFSDGAEWWSDEIRIYDGYEDPDWLYARGDFFRTATGKDFESPVVDLEFPTTIRYDGQPGQAAVLHFENLQLTAFR